jgi:hypothetical protein
MVKATTPRAGGAGRLRGGERGGGRGGKGKKKEPVEEVPRRRSTRVKKMEEPTAENEAEDLDEQEGSDVVMEEYSVAGDIEPTAEQEQERESDVAMEDSSSEQDDQREDDGQGSDAYAGTEDDHQDERETSRSSSKRRHDAESPQDPIAVRGPPSIIET